MGIEDIDTRSKGTEDRQATILLSGGIDSMVCAYLLISQGFRVGGVYVDYGQPAANQERSAAERMAKALPLESLELCDASGRAPLNSGVILGRNAFLIFSALTLSGVSRGLLCMGIHKGTPYYDCTQNFSQSISEILCGYTDGCLQLHLPLLEWSKAEIFDYAIENRLPIGITYSCEAGSSPPCGNCLSCLDRRSIGC